MKEVTIYTDGGCDGNPGPGGWAAILTCGNAVKEISGSILATTNNRMELTAGLEALKALKQPCRVRIFTDSQYLKKGITEFIHSWKRNGWKKGKIKNIDLWKALDEAVATHEVSWFWTRGHAGDEKNERCDVLAAEAISKLKQAHSAAALAAARETFVAERSKMEGQIELL